MVLDIFLLFVVEQRVALFLHQLGKGEHLFAVFFRIVGIVQIVAPFLVFIEVDVVLFEFQLLAALLAPFLRYL